MQATARKPRPFATGPVLFSGPVNAYYARASKILRGRFQALPTSPVGERRGT